MLEHGIPFLKLHTHQRPFTPDTKFIIIQHIKPVPGNCKMCELTTYILQNFFKSKVRKSKDNPKEE